MILVTRITTPRLPKTKPKIIANGNFERFGIIVEFVITIVPLLNVTGVTL